MLDRALLKRLFKALDAELGKAGVRGEIGLCGGAVMCLVFNTRESTRDVDAVFKPTRELRAAAARVAGRFGLPEDWLNDAAKGFFLSEPPKEEFLELPHLRIWVPSADYMLAMKCVSARFDTHDRDDVRFLIRRLSLKDPASVFAVIERYYPRKQVPAKTVFFVEELFET